MDKIKILLSLLFAVGLVFAIQPAEGWNVGAIGKYTQTGQANVTTEGGNVTNLNLSSNISTEKWAGYWGNVSGGIVLSPGASMFYTWAWNPSDGGEVCAVAAPSGFAWSTLQAIAGSVIDGAWGFDPLETDSGQNTFTSLCNVDIAGQTVIGSDGTTTGGGTFETCLIGDGGGIAKNHVAFCVNITQAGNLFNGLTGDYELMAATNETAGTTEMHYFWLELD